MTAPLRHRIAFPFRILAACILIASPLVAQAHDLAPGSTRTPRVAVVLSGGGAKGIAHIGVLQVLEEEGISPRIVSGTSMGALVGGLYAMGYSPAALDSLVNRLDWPSYFSDATDYRFLGLERRRSGDRTLLNVPMTHWRPSLPSGAITGQRISRLLSTLTWPAQSTRDFRSLPRAFVAVATDIETGQAVVLDHGSLADAMRASMSLPSIFEPVTLDGRLLVDGGIVRNLPASDAKALGADIIICSDVADPLLSADNLRSLADVLMQTITFQMNASTEAQRKLCDVYIRPDISGLTATDFSRPDVIVARGTSAANAMRAQLRALRLPAQAATFVRHAPWVDSIQATQIVVEGLTGRAALRVRRALELYDSTWYSPAALDSAVQRAYGTGLYERVQYRVDAAGTDTSIVVRAIPRVQDLAGFGFRFDDTYKASLLFAAVLRNLLGTGSTTTLELRLGEQLKLGVEHISNSVQNPRYTFSGGAALIRTPFPIYDNGNRIAEITSSIAALHAFTGAHVGRYGGVGLDVATEVATATAAIAIRDSSRHDAFASVGAVFFWDALDRPVYPRRGVSLFARTEFGTGRTTFVQHLARARLALPISGQLTVLTDATVGTSTRADQVPVQRRFKIGGAYPGVLFPDQQIVFVGLRPTEEFGTSVVAAGLAAQLELRRGTFATLRTNTGYAGSPLTLDHRLYHTGAGLSLGALTAFGQIEVTASAQDRRGGTRLELNLGRMF